MGSLIRLQARREPCPLDAAAAIDTAAADAWEESHYCADHCGGLTPAECWAAHRGEVVTVHVCAVCGNGARGMYCHDKCEEAEREHLQ